MQAIIEMPKGTRYKYEIDKKTGEMTIDRPLSVSIPFNYGFIPNTLADDGDPLDVFIVTHEAIPPLTKIKIVPFAIIKGIDNGRGDDKVLARLLNDKHYFSEREAIDLVVDYLKNYKQNYVIVEIGDDLAADNAIEETMLPE